MPKIVGLFCQTAPRIMGSSGGNVVSDHGLGAISNNGSSVIGNGGSGFQRK